MKKSLFLFFALLLTLAVNAQSVNEILPALRENNPTKAMIQHKLGTPRNIRHNVKTDEHIYLLKDLDSIYSNIYVFYYEGISLVKIDRFDGETGYVTFWDYENGLNTLFTAQTLPADSAALSDSSALALNVTPAEKHLPNISCCHLSIRPYYEQINNHLAYSGYDIHYYRTNHIYEINDKDDQATYYLPDYLFNRYSYGKGLYTAGAVTISVGCVFEFIGGVLYGVGLKNRDSGLQKGGYACLSIGSTAITVSIPLLCFGSHLKHESDVEFSLFNTKR